MKIQEALMTGMVFKRLDGQNLYDPNSPIFTLTRDEILAGDWVNGSPKITMTEDEFRAALSNAAQEGPAFDVNAPGVLQGRVNL